MGPVEPSETIDRSTSRDGGWYLRSYIKMKIKTYIYNYICLPREIPELLKDEEKSFLRPFPWTCWVWVLSPSRTWTIVTGCSSTVRTEPVILPSELPPLLLRVRREWYLCKGTAVGLTRSCGRYRDEYPSQIEVPFWVTCV